MSFDMNRGNGSLHSDYTSGNLAAGGELGRRGIEEMNARAASEMAGRGGGYASSGEGDALGKFVLYGLLCFGVYAAAMFVLPESISTPLHSFFGTAAPLVIFAGVALAVLILSFHAAVFLVKALWAALKLALVVAAALVVWIIAYNIYLLFV